MNNALQMAHNTLHLPALPALVIMSALIWAETVMYTTGTQMNTAVKWVMSAA